MPAGIGNPITAVLLDYRAFDTLLEKVVLLLALLGVWSVTPDRLWGGRPGPRHRADADGVLTFLAQMLPPIGIVIGIHVLWVGAVGPGGAFQAARDPGGDVDSGRAGRAGRCAADRGNRRLRLVLVAGPALFIAVGFAGFPLAGSFLAYPGGLRQAADPRRRSRADALHRRHPGAAGGGPARADTDSNERRHTVRPVRRGAGGSRPVRPDRASPAAAQRSSPSTCSAAGCSCCSA